MGRSIIAIVTISLSAVCSFSASYAGNGDDSFPRDTLVLCDSAWAAILTQQILIGNGYYPGSHRVEMVLSQKAEPFALFLDRRGTWHEPIFRTKREYWPATNDSVTIAVHRLVNLDRYLLQRSGDDFSTDIYQGIVANLIWTPTPDSFYTEKIELHPVVFPDESYWYWDWGGNEVDVGLLHLGNASSPLLYAKVGLTAPHDCETYTHWVNEGLWCRRGDQYVPLGLLELSRRSSKIDGYDRKDLVTVHRVEDIDNDGVSELIYARKYIEANEGKQTQFSDIGDIIIEFDEGDPVQPRSGTIGNVSGRPPGRGGISHSRIPQRGMLRPERIDLPNGLSIPIRPYLPVLLFPGDRAWGSPELIFRQGIWSSSVGPITESRHSVHLGPGYIIPYEEQGKQRVRRPTMSIALAGDSVEFEVALYQQSSENSSAMNCPEANYQVSLWIDTDLYADFGDSSISNDDIAFVVRCSAVDSSASVERLEIVNNQGEFTYITSDARSGIYLPSRKPETWPNIIRWRLDRRELGLVELRGFPAACGFATGIRCADKLSSVEWSRPAADLRYPPNYNHRDPRSWTMLMIADRKDTLYTSK